ncbi:hypothetical protein HKD37_01G000508 [Glycine soja]
MPEVSVGCHNHDLAKILVGHSYVGQLSVEEKSLVNDMIRNMVKLLEHDHYVYWHREIDGSNVIRDIFWLHPGSIELLSTFSIALLADKLTFSVAFSYVEFEQANNFTWVLKQLRESIINR